jgi:peroxiredoxin/outer membrane lipoprotein-sorting protein
MFKSFVMRTGACLTLAAAFCAAQNLSPDEVCRKVAETYKNLRMFQFAAQVSVEYAARGATASGETFYSLAMVRPEKVRLTVKDAQRELIIVSDGETTWKYLPKTRQYTKESAAALEDDEEQPPSRGEVDPLTEAQNTLINRYVGLARYAPVATLAKNDRLKVGGEKIDCYVLEIRMPEGPIQIWVDRQRFIVLKQVQSAKVRQNGLEMLAKSTFNIKSADISTAPENDLFSFTPPGSAVEAQTLNLPGERPNLTGRVAQDFTLKALDGDKVSLNGLRGHVVLLDFWATWCPPCRAELPEIEKIRHEFSDKGLVVLGINDEESGVVKSFVKKNQYDLPVLMDSKREVHRMYGARAIPTVIVIDRDGVIKAHYVGGRSREDLIAALRTAGIE